ncbi:MAG: PQQ-binding-like beta-propeller repeat protein, partial [Rhodomicrobium sp.]
FRKLDRNGDGSIELAEAENPDVAIERHPLDGHFFLGPPLAFDGRLYAVTECDCQLNLVALAADTGAVLWIQGVGYVDRPIDEDSARYTQSCTPCCAGGVIVCPTQIGILVGVDALDGALLWTYYYGDEDVSSPDSGWSFLSHRSLGNTGFACQPIIERNRVIVNCCRKSKPTFKHANRHLEPPPDNSFARFPLARGALGARRGVRSNHRSYRKRRADNVIRRRPAHALGCDHA